MRCFVTFPRMSAQWCLSVTQGGAVAFILERIWQLERTWQKRAAAAADWHYTFSSMRDQQRSTLLLLPAVVQGSVTGCLVCFLFMAWCAEAERFLDRVQCLLCSVLESVQGAFCTDGRCSWAQNRLAMFQDPRKHSEPCSQVSTAISVMGIAGTSKVEKVLRC